jgi:hypothetical protein
MSTYTRAEEELTAILVTELLVSAHVDTYNDKPNLPWFVC